VNESKLLRWILRDRQKSGIRKRAAQSKAAPDEVTPAPAAPSKVPEPAPTAGPLR
jgi:hypothetical protein